jgi:diacylglycerol kinase family enzyme
VNVWILCNEAAGVGHEADELSAQIEEAGHTILGVAKQYDESTPLPNRRVDLVVAAGGDGTVATAAGIAFRTSAPLAILPLGTANNIASSLGIKGPASTLVASWETARRVPFDLGRAQAASKEWLVVEGVGGGLVPAGIARAQAELKKRPTMSPSHEIEAALRIFRDTLLDLAPRPWTLAIDGQRITDEFLLVEVLNIRSIGPNLVFAPDATPSDGYFHVVLVQESHRQEVLTYLEHRATGRATRLALPCHRARHVAIGSCLELHVDDERIDTCELGTMSVSIEPAAIDVLL